jgi:mannose-6-phosphate isomerase-like protein (cupin superfamily)
MEKYDEERPWGGFERFTLNENSTVKILTIEPHQKFSLQKHKNRTELWKFLDNPAKVTIGDKTFTVKKGDEVRVPKKTLHRIEALSKVVHVLEISFGKFKEDDITRIKDAYGRIAKTRIGLPKKIIKSSISAAKSIPAIPKAVVRKIIPKKNRSKETK